jgi:putative phage-type endonuclease
VNPVSENVVGPTLLGDARERWLARRRELITASDVAAILGEDPRRGPLVVYAEKIGALEPGDNPYMRRGRRFEPVIAAEYADETGRPVFDLDPYEIVIHPDIPWLGATPDRMTAGCERNPAPAEGRAPLELKNVTGGNVREWKEEPPIAFQIQLQIQMACTKASWGSLTALLAGLKVDWTDFTRDDSFLEAVVPRLDEFRLRVQRREPPDADGFEATAAALRGLFAEGDGTTAYLEDALPVVEGWEKAKADERAAQARARELRHQLLLRVGPSSFANLPDGTYLERTTVERKAYDVREGRYETLRRKERKVPLRRRT